MIPLQLHIKNFLSYGSPTQCIDFTAYHLICLSGKNGHGKSALLDAITWAVWGHARKSLGVSKADEGLLRIGQTAMMVSLDFMCNNNRYRVRREFSYDRGKGVTQLDFGIIDPETNKLRPLTDKTIRATQSVIERTIGLDFDAFINSVFLRQGNSNEFSKKSPKERKEIIAAILGLARYELLRQGALDKVRESASAAQALTERCNRITSELQQLAICQEEMNSLMAHITQLNEEETQLTQRTTELTQERTSAQQAEQRYQQYAFELKHLEQQRTTALDALLREVTTWRSVHRQQRRLGTHRSPVDKKKLQESVAILQAVIQKRLQLSESIRNFSQQQQLHAQRLEKLFIKQQESLQATVHALEMAATARTAQQTQFAKTLREQHEELQRLETDIRKQREKAQQLTALQERLGPLQAQFERRKNFYHTYAARGNFLSQEVKQVAHKKQLALHAATATCTLCEQQLTESTRHALQHKFSAQEQRISHQISRLSRVLSTLKTRMTEQHAELQTLQETVTHARQAAHSLQELEARHARLEALNKATRLEEVKLSVIEKEQAPLLMQAQQELTAHKASQATHLMNDATYRDITEQLAKCTHDLEQQHYDHAHYERLLKELASLEDQETAQENFQQEVARQDHRKKEIQNGIATLRALKQQEQIRRRDQAPYATYHERQKTALERERELEHQKQALFVAKEQVAHQKGALEQRILYYTQQATVLQEEQHKLVLIKQEGSEYHMLSQALSKDGIQGLLIEHVLPEIEQEANALLSKLTNNQAHLRIESVRDLKSGGAKETLDIKISDALGIRPYEMFSGGEAFRIDFALRLAISKLLARRAGTSLQTLIIDEGFGSQDEEGLNHIMECLYMIQDEFAKIIIVSHLPSMKEQFPTHFYVSKGPRGSTVQVIEQG